jgi:hypothetical protein
VSNFLAGLPIVGGLFDDSQDKAQQELAQNKKLYDSLVTPDFKEYDPERYDLVGTYKPEEMTADTINEDPSLKNNEMMTLDRLRGLSETGLSDVDNLGYERARQEAGQISNAGTEAALANATARGVGGSGLEFGMREKASQDAAQREQDMAAQQAAKAAEMRAAYTQAYGGMLGNVRGEDYRTAAANTDILNKFTEANTTNANYAQQYNLGQKQGVANANVQNKNQAQQYNNDLDQREYDDQLKKVSGQAGAGQAVAQGYAAENAANKSTQNSLLNAGVNLYGAVTRPKKADEV